MVEAMELHMEGSGSIAVQLIPSDLSRECVDALRSAVVGMRQGENNEALWSGLVAGEWNRVGMTEERGGAGLSLLDLSALAVEWGRYLLPLPFVPTVLLNRWNDGFEGDGSAPSVLEAATYSVPIDRPSESRGLMPFSHFSGIVEVVDLRPFTTRPSPSRDSTEGSSGQRGTTTIDLDACDWTTQNLSEERLAEVVILGSAELLGCGCEMIRLSSTYALERVQFGRPIAGNQAVQHRLADMVRDLEVARTAITWAANEPESAIRAAGVGFECIRRVLESAIQIHGGYGCTWDAGLHFYLRHLWEWARLMVACGVSIPI
jgi:hypothetical protein